MTDDTLLQELADRRAIDDVLYRYAHALDSRDWDLLRTCFTEDAVADYLELGGVNEGREAIVDLCAGVLTGLDASQHMIGSPVARGGGGTPQPPRRPPGPARIRGCCLTS